MPCNDSSYPEHIPKWAVSKKGKVLFLASALLAELAFLKIIHEQAGIFTNVLVSWNYLMHCLRQHIPDSELLTTDYSCLLLPVSAVCNVLFVLGEWLSESQGFRAALSLDASSVPPGPGPKPTESTRKVPLTPSGCGPAQGGCGILTLGTHCHNTIRGQKSIPTNIPLLLGEREHKQSRRRLKPLPKQYSQMPFTAFICALSTVHGSQKHKHLQLLAMLINRAVRGFLMHSCQVLHSRSYSQSSSQER